MNQLVRISLVAVLVALGASTVSRLASQLPSEPTTKTTRTHIGVCAAGTSC